jgi:hypothetical protein
MVPAKPGKPGSMKTLRLMVLLVFNCAFAYRFCFAQLKYIAYPACGDNPAVLSQILKSSAANDKPQLVLRTSAIGGESLIPILKTLSKPRQPAFTVAGAAQVALARLGDAQSLTEMREEIQGKTSMMTMQGMQKLAMVRSDASLSIMMEYLIQNKVQAKRVLDEGDTIEDPLLPALQGIISMLEDPPYQRADVGLDDPSHLDSWQKWWDNTKSPRITPIYESLTDSKARCLARLAEWGDADSVTDFYLYSGTAGLPVLKRLANLGDKSIETSWLNTVRGKAQTILAKENDHKQFEEIVSELNGSLYADAIKKLQYIGGKNAVEALIHALSLSNFMNSDYWKTRDENYIAAEGQKLKVLDLAVLSLMIENPPLPASAEPSSANIQKWQQWWEKNKETARFKTMPL